MILVKLPLLMQFVLHLGRLLMIIPGYYTTAQHI